MQITLMNIMYFETGRFFLSTTEISSDTPSMKFTDLQVDTDYVIQITTILEEKYSESKEMKAKTGKACVTYRNLSRWIQNMKLERVSQCKIYWGSAW